MKNYVLYSVFYMMIMFLVGVFYQDAHGNIFYLFITFIGLVYNLLIIFRTNFLSKEIRFLDAGFIGVTTCFLIFNGGLIPLMYLKNFDFIEANAFGIYLDYDVLVKFAIVTGLGNITYWLGYKSKVGDYLFALYYKGFNYQRLLHLDIGVSFPKFLIVFGILLNFVLFANGAFGRGTADIENFTGIVRYLIAYSSYIEKISLIGYFILALNYFQSGRHKTWFWTTLVIQIIFALISGARGPIIFLFILTLIPYYYVYRRISKNIIISGALTFLIAFTVASEIKVFTQSVNNENISVTDYAESYMKFREPSSDELNRRIYNSLYYAMMRRLNTVAQGSLAMDYKDTHGVANSDPNFSKELLMMPVYTFIPRSKLGSAFPSWGQWFRLKVLKQNNDTYLNNITFGAVGYFYLTGKLLFVLIGFFLYGVSLRFTNKMLHLKSDISFLIYLAMISAIGYIAAAIPTAFISFFRFAIFLPLFFYIIIKFFNRVRI